MKVNELKYSAQFVLALGWTCLLLLAGLLIALQWPIGAVGPTWIIALNKTVAEMLLVVSLSLLLFSPWRLLRWVSGLIFCAYALIMMTQIAALQFSSKYLPPIALENAEHADFLLDSSKIGWLLLTLIALTVSALHVKRQIASVPHLGARARIAAVLIVAAILVKNDSHWLPDGWIDKRHAFYNSGQASIEHRAPVSAMLSTLKLHFQAMSRQRWIEQASTELSKESAEFAYEFNIQLNQQSNDYPLLKLLEFKQPPHFLSASDWQKKNMIVFFVEGMSSRIIQPYTNHFPDISPNLEDFSKFATVVDDYYNHSYATYRGLSGQFCSIYANGRLNPETDYYCLPHALEDNGFDTHFFVSQSLAKTDLDEVAERAGFKYVYGSKELSTYIPDDPEMDFTLKDYILYDTSFIESFKRWLKEKESGDQDKPFFASLYNFQTHTGVRLNSDVTYTDPTGKNSSYVLDTFHNFDLAFGNFWRYFKQSPYFDNTIVVVTTDHATFGSKDFAKLVRDTPGYVQIFADKIPLMIYHPSGNRQPVSARNASSINLAPSLLHTLNISLESAPFLGNSIFEPSHKYPNPMVASSGISYFNVGGKHWVRQVRDTPSNLPANAVQAKPFHDLILFTQNLEHDNRLFPKKP